MQTRPVSRLMATSLALSASLLAVGCGDELSDTDFGGVDLIEFFGDAAGGDPPASYKPQGGWLDGERVRYYDFGRVAVREGFADVDLQQELDIQPDETIPKSAPVNPMYFFFDSDNNPLFSAPVREARTGRFFMPGGLDVRNPNPTSDASRSVAYPVRARDLLEDRNRGVADYQRPIVDVILDREDAPIRNYSGIWEVVLVKAPSGYQPDAIKSWDTLNKGWDLGNGSFELVQTGKLINCPLVDSRSVIVPNVSAYDLEDLRSPQPRIELWFRQKRVDCFLVNGWESIGVTVADDDGEGQDSYQLFPFNDLESRVAVMDIETETFGEGTAQRSRAVAPIGRLYLPKVEALDLDAFISTQHVTQGALPRRSKSDPPGYRPIRWWWNIEVLDISAIGAGFEEKAFLGENADVPALNDIRGIDDSLLAPRRGDGGSFVRNFPITAKPLDCLEFADAFEAQDSELTVEDDPCRRFGLICSALQQGNDAICEEPKVNYGDYCAPTISQCWDRTNKPTKRNKGDIVDFWFFQPKHQLLFALEGVRDRFRDAEIPEDVLEEREVLEERGVTWVDFNETQLYECQGDNFVDTGIGHCYLSCRGGFANLLQGQTQTETVTVDGQDTTIELPLDSRCGGGRMPGFQCVPIFDPTDESGGSFCMRTCDSTQPLGLSAATCQRPTPMWLSENKGGPGGFDLGKDTVCTPIRADASNDSLVFFDACTYDLAFEPR